MSNDTKKEQVKETIDVIAEQTISKDDRDVQMFRDWLIHGMTFRELGAKYNMSFSNAKKISDKYDWKGLRQEYRRRQFNATIDRIRDITVMVQDILEEDVKRMIDSVKKSDRMLTKEERDHLRSVYDRFLKEVRLDEGKPTELSNQSGPMRVEVVVPPGTRGFGLIPPDPKTTTLIEASPESDKNKIDLDMIEEDEGSSDA